MGIKRWLWVAGSLIFSWGLQAQRFDENASPPLRYTLEVKLDERAHELHGNLRLVYRNVSPDTLHELFFHLWPNAYANRHTPLAKQLVKKQNRSLYFAQPDENGSIDSIAFSQEGRDLPLRFLDPSHEIAAITPLAPLAPGDSVLLQTPFRVRIPSNAISRLGHLGNQYQITQWYPKPAVYAEGAWHTYPYLTQGEFYSPFAHFDVSIDIPSHYTIGATGNLQTAAENRRMWLISDAIKSGIPIDSSALMDFDSLNFGQRKVVRFTQNQVHDFAWFTDPEYAVIVHEFRSEQVQKEIRVEVFFREKDYAAWKNAPLYAERAINFYSEKVGSYPYDVVKIVDGALSAGAGMEYPTITVIPRPASEFSLDRVIAHELGHNWFYGILASDERANPWMDEGMNSAIEYQYLAAYYPDRTLLGPKSKRAGLRELLGINHLSAWDDAYVLEQFLSRSGLNQPVSDSAHRFSAIGYGALVYGKAAMLMEGLRVYLGDDSYQDLLHAYYETFRFTHPKPEDVWSTFEIGLQPNHDIRSAFTTIKPINYGWKRWNTSTPTLINRGKISFPVTVGVFERDSLIDLIRTPALLPGESLPLSSLPLRATRLMIDPHRALPEWNRRDNYYAINAWPSEKKPLKLRWLGGLDNPRENTIFFTPDARWNNYDKLMTGITLYNKSLIPRTFEYRVAPMYAWGSRNLSGSASAIFNIIPSGGPVSKIQLGVYGKMNEYAPDLSFYRLSPTANLWFRRSDLSIPLEHSLRIRWVQLKRELGDFNFESGEVQLEANRYRVFELRYRLMNGHGVQPHWGDITLQHAQAFTKLSATAEYRRFWSDNRLFRGRVFAGTFVRNTIPAEERYYNFGLSGTQDYMFDYYFLGRSDVTGLWSRQFFVTDGGAKAATATFANRWMIASNVQIPLLWRINYYIDAAWYQNDGLRDTYLGHGLNLNLLTDFMEIYFPLPTDNSWQSSNYTDQIRFVLNLSLDDAFKRILRGQL